jgi:hypothetical protein
VGTDGSLSPRPSARSTQGMPFHAHEVLEDARMGVTHAAHAARNARRAQATSPRRRPHRALPERTAVRHRDGRGTAVRSAKKSPIPPGRLTTRNRADRRAFSVGP